MEYHLFVGAASPWERKHSGKQKGGEEMSLEAIQTITESEQGARQRLQAAAEEAKKIVAEAERTGQAKVAQARAGAEAEAKAMMKQAEERAAQQEAAVMEEVEQSCQAMRQAAQGRLPAAVELIVRRVGNV